MRVNEVEPWIECLNLKRDLKFLVMCEDLDFGQMLNNHTKNVVKNCFVIMSYLKNQLEDRLLNCRHSFRFNGLKCFKPRRYK